MSTCPIGQLDNVKISVEPVGSDDELAQGPIMKILTSQHAVCQNFRKYASGMTAYGEYQTFLMDSIWVEEKKKDIKKKKESHPIKAKVC